MRALAAAIALTFATAAQSAPVNDSSLFRSDYLTGFSSPTGLRFTGPNEGFVIEKGGAVKFFSGSTVSTALNLAVNTDSERGLLGIALDPGFASNKLLYLYYSEGNASTWTANRLNRFTWNGTSLVETPFTAARTFGTSSDGFTQNGPNHNGGPLVFGADGKLYGVTGDLNRNGIEQNQSATVSAQTGGVYRLNSDGTIPDDNPFNAPTNVDGVRPWYAYGVRNSFGIAVDPAPAAAGRIWFTENGPTNYDEINLLTAGMNSGWEQIMGPDARDPQGVGDLTALTGSTYRDPKFSFNSAIGITSLQFLHGAWGGGAYDNAVIVGDVNTGSLWLLRLNTARDGFELTGGLADGVLDSGDTLAKFGDGYGIVTDLQVGADGNLYIVELNGRISQVALVPEPHTWALTLLGLAAVGWGARARRGRG